MTSLWPVLALGALLPSTSGVDPLIGSPRVPDLRDLGGLASVIEDAAAAIILFDQAGSITLANAMAGRMFGYEHGDLLGEPVESLFSRSSQDILLEDRAAYVEHRDPPAVDAGRHLFAVRRDGSEFPAEVGFSSVRTPEGGFVKAIVTDLSELVALAKELERSDRRLRRVIETAPSGIVVVDADGIGTLVNRAAELMFGYDRHEFVGSPIEELLSGVVGDPDPERTLERPGAPPAGVGREVVATRKDGEEFTVEVALSAVQSDDGPLITAILTDVTERKRAEAELRESMETLRRSENKRRILLGQLVRATEDERSRLAGEVHDGSVQAMTAVGMRLETLKRRFADAGVEEMADFEQIQSEVSAAVASLRLLMFDLRPPALDEAGVGAALEEALTRLEVETSFDATGFEEPPSELRTILFRVGQEALANARKHADAVAVEVRLSSDLSGWRMEIADDGRGFEPSTVIEDPMHMGLASMRERAEMGGGTLRIVSAPGEGTTVEVSLPRRAA